MRVTVSRAGQRTVHVNIPTEGRAPEHFLKSSFLIPTINSIYNRQEASYGEHHVRDIPGWAEVFFKYFKVNNAYYKARIRLNSTEIEQYYRSMLGEQVAAVVACPYKFPRNWSLYSKGGIVTLWPMKAPDHRYSSRGIKYIVLVNTKKIHNRKIVLHCPKTLQGRFIGKQGACIVQMLEELETLGIRVNDFKVIPDLHCTGSPRGVYL